MGTYIKYTDENNIEIPKEQLHKLSEFNCLIYDSTTNELKKIERFSKNYRTKEIEQLGGEIYLSSEDQLPKVITNHIDIGSFGKPWTFYYNKEKNNKGEAQWEYVFYRNGSLFGKGVFVFDDRNRKLAGCAIDLMTGLTTDKFKNFYGDPSVFDDEFQNETIPNIQFKYKEDDSIEEIYFQDEDYSLRDFLNNDEISMKFNWKENTYYHSFEPLFSSN
ncbi:hypothetical protein [Chryseobacterium viscerum]|uniref:Uncharacterized protein n=1 Tax=Chryseobacterium viscerum TaxID=1037377 RepID=A0A5N4BRU2_9FLAO|nr:hypothetical protein [Chryseobacterium viscerum]KAB1231143.1 hypothetical protein F8D52_08740 [Chryseobacterium viscerum]